MLTALLLLVSTQSGCRPGVVIDGGVAVLSVDLDGDAVADELRVDRDRQVELRFSKPPTTTSFWMGWEKFGGLEVPLEDLPPIRGRSRDYALRFIEDRIFDRTCAAPDPSFLRLRQQREKLTPLNWVKGPVQPPFAYLLREKSAWMLYRWYCNPGGFGPAPLQEAAREGKWVALKACHGVVLNDLENKQFAWLYLVDKPVDKLRHSSIGDVAIADGGVTIQLTLDTLDAPDFVEVQVRIDDGSIKVVEGKRK